MVRTKPHNKYALPGDNEVSHDSFAYQDSIACTDLSMQAKNQKARVPTTPSKDLPSLVTSAGNIVI